MLRFFLKLPPSKWAPFKVEMPDATTTPPALTLTPVLAVTRPTESMLVTSSYVSVPPTETLPLKEPVVPVTDPTVISGVPVSAVAFTVPER